MSPLQHWESFYVIVGSSAGALTGLQFVVMTLIAQTDRVSGRGESIAAFGTPNVVHFCSALLVSSALSVPWDSLEPASLTIAIFGVLGVSYSVAVIRRAHRQREYVPVFEDWLWHTMLPVLAYSALLVAGAVLVWSPPGALLAIAAATLLLVFIGIHNSWDTVTYVTMRAKSPSAPPAPRSEAPGPPATGSAPPSGALGP